MKPGGRPINFNQVMLPPRPVGVVEQEQMPCAGLEVAAVEVGIRAAADDHPHVRSLRSAAHSRGRKTIRSAKGARSSSLV